MREKTSKKQYPYPYQRVFNSTLEAVRANDFKVKSSDQTQGMIEATTSPSLKSWGEKIKIEIRTLQDRTEVSISSRAKAQLFTWGKNETNINDIFQTLDNILRNQPVQKRKKKVKTCPSCGSQNFQDAIYCIDCGTSLQGKQIAEDTKTKPPPPPPPKDRSNNKDMLRPDEINDEISVLKEENKMIDTREIESALEEGKVEKAEELLEELKGNYEEYKGTIEELESLDERKSSLAEKLADDEIDKNTYDDAIQNIEHKKADLEEKLNDLRKEVIHEDYEKPF